MAKVDISHELHVLAVDDRLVDRKVIERLLKISSCKVTTVDSGRRALQYIGLDDEENNNVGAFNGLKVNLIIKDYWMPEMTGYELMKKIKESSAFKEIPVVIMSSENVSSPVAVTWGFGSAIGHRVGDFMFGPRTVHYEMVETPSPNTSGGVDTSEIVSMYFEFLSR